MHVEKLILSDIMQAIGKEMLATGFKKLAYKARDSRVGQHVIKHKKIYAKVAFFGVMLSACAGNIYQLYQAEKSGFIKVPKNFMKEVK